jgi:sugar lactone lactonase YvrE
MMLDWFTALANDLNHSEGVTWNPFDGRIYTGGEGGEFYAISTDGEVECIGSTGGSMLGLAVDGQGRIYACDAGRGEIARLDMRTREISVYARGVGGVDLDTPNVLAFGPDGMAYVTCLGEDERPEIVRIAPGGITETWTKAVPRYPNGCLVTPDGSALVVVEAQAQRLVMVPILADGSAGDPQTIAELPDTDADGVGLATDGSYWVTLYRPDGLLRVTPDGLVETIVDDHLASHFDAPTNIAWFGPLLDRAVVANVGGRHLSVADVGVAGAPLHYPEVP